MKVLVDTSVWSLALRRRDREGYLRLRDHLRAFPDEPLETADHERAAEWFTACRAAGLQGSNTDFLLCAVSERHRLPLLTTDEEFARFARVLPIVRHPVRD